MGSSKRISLFALAWAIAVAMPACSRFYMPTSWSGPAVSAPVRPASYWVGKDVEDAMKELGPPTSVEYNQGLGPNAAGKTFMFANPGQPHYIFQTRAGSSTILTAQAIR